MTEIRVNVSPGQVVVRSDFPGTPPTQIVARRQALPWATGQRVSELVGDALRLLELANAMPVESAPDEPNPQGLATFDPMESPRYRAVARAAVDGYLERRGMAPAPWPEDSPRYPVEDGPGAGSIVEVTVRAMIGPERSTVIVRTGRDPASLHEVREHGHEAYGIGAAVEAAVREGVGRLHNV